jgi:hypothetical protein
VDADFTVNVCMVRTFKVLLAALRTRIFKRKKKKREKRKPLKQAVFEGLSRFLRKILPDSRRVGYFL